MPGFICHMIFSHCFIWIFSSSAGFSDNLADLDLDLSPAPPAPRAPSPIIGWPPTQFSMSSVVQFKFPYIDFQCWFHLAILLNYDHFVVVCLLLQALNKRVVLSVRVCLPMNTTCTCTIRILLTIHTDVYPRGYECTDIMSGCKSSVIKLGICRHSCLLEHFCSCLWVHICFCWVETKLDAVLYF